MCDVIIWVEFAYCTQT